MPPEPAPAAPDGADGPASRPGQEAQPRQRQSRRPGPWRLLAPLVFAAAGLLFATSFQTAAGTGLRSDRTLPDLIEAATRDVAARSARLVTLQSEVDALTAARAPSDGRVGQLTMALAALAPSTGVRGVTGPGVTVVLDDSSTPISNLPASVRPDDLVVHQQDVQAVVNALWRGGAEAMMIQDQRVIATSAVRCVGNTLILQGRVYSPPFTIAAIGRPSDLRAALDRDPQVQIYRQWVGLVGLGYDVSAADRLTFPAYSGSVSLSYAKVAR